MYCFQCGTELPSTAKYCPSCGKEQVPKKSGMIRITFSDKPKKKKPKKNEFEIINRIYLMIAYWYVYISTLLFIIFVLARVFMGNLYGIILGVGAFLIFYYFTTAYPYIKDFPEAFLIKNKALTSGLKTCGYISLFSAILVFAVGVMIIYFAIDEKGYKSIDLSFFGIIGIIILVNFYGLSIFYYVIRTFKILGKQNAVRLDLTIIKVKHNSTNEIEEVSLRKWEEIKTEFGEENYEIIEEEQKQVTIRNISTKSVETISLKTWELRKEMYGEDKYEILNGRN